MKALTWLALGASLGCSGGSFNAGSAAPSGGQAGSQAMPTSGSAGASGGAALGGASSGSGGTGGVAMNAGAGAAPLAGAGGSGGSMIAPEGRVPAFVLQGHMGRTAISCDDGKSWVHNQSVDDNVRCFENMLDCDHSEYASTGLAYGNGWFVTAWGWGHPGTLDRSKDGVTWERVMDMTPTFANLTFGEGKFLANSTPMRVSTDAAQWDKGGDPGLMINQRSIDFVDYQGGRFIMTAESGTTREILYSSDGTTWNKASTRPDLCGSYYTGFAAANGIAVLSEGQGNICYTKDGGDTWSIVKLDEQISSPVVWAGTEFRVYSGSTLHTSQDGMTWSKETIDPPNIAIGPLGISPQGTMVAANAGWQVWYEKQQFFRSTDGRKWEVLGADKFVGSHYLRFIKFGYVEPGAGCPAQ